MKILGLTGKTRIYKASTGELYGLMQETLQKERTPFYLRKPLWGGLSRRPLRKQ